MILRHEFEASQKFRQSQFLSVTLIFLFVGQYSHFVFPWTTIWGEWVKSTFVPTAAITCWPPLWNCWIMTRRSPMHTHAIHTLFLTFIPCQNFALEPIRLESRWSRCSCPPRISLMMHTLTTLQLGYPLVKVYITMENHHFWWENSL